MARHSLITHQACRPAPAKRSTPEPLAAKELTTSRKEEGFAEGQHEATLTIVKRMLKICFGRLSPRVRKSVSALSVEELVNLANALVDDFTDRKDLEKWLAIH